MAGVALTLKTAKGWCELGRFMGHLTLPCAGMEKVF